MRYVGLGLLCMIVAIGVGCSLFQGRVAPVDDEGYVVDSAGNRVKDKDGNPIQIPDTATVAIGVLLGSRVLGMGGALLTKVPPAGIWGIAAHWLGQAITAMFGGSGLAKKAKA